jgi:hypothetical protein
METNGEYREELSIGTFRRGIKLRRPEKLIAAMNPAIQPNPGSL